MIRRISNRNRGKEQLNHSLGLLSKQSKLEYTGEYGTEMTTFLPFIAWLKQEGLLRGKKIISYQGMRPYYFFLADDEFEEKDEARRFISVARRYWPYNNDFADVSNPWNIYPDFRAHYKNSNSLKGRPVLFIQNKFTVEWDIGPINYIPLHSLRRLLEITAEKYHVVYSCPRQPPSGYSNDHNTACDYPDRAIVNQFDHATDLERDCLSSGQDYNLTKLRILANTHLFVSVQGGGANVLPYFGDSLVLLFHIKGKEYPYTYKHGAYKNLSKTPPKLLLARNISEFEKGISLISHIKNNGENIVLPSPYRRSGLPWSARTTMMRLSI